ncbi:Non-heme dioxygenase N-terminal domain [Sesbania bispinosa]|nr:Non-heme dioxygenase N-terminal domain [Sesbania bispinosa]
MEHRLVSSWFHLHSSVPSSYVPPPENRPGMVAIASGKTIPVVDLVGQDHAETLRHILRASEEYGFFQVINHGISKELMDDTLNIFKEFHAMPAKEKISESSRDPNGSCKLYTSGEINNKDGIQYWRDTLRHFCPPSGEFVEFWPQKPEKYRSKLGVTKEETMVPKKSTSSVGVFYREVVAFDDATGLRSGGCTKKLCCRLS